MMTICCLCKKILGGASCSSRNEIGQERISHGYCPECYQKMMKQFRSVRMNAGSGNKRMLSS